MNESSNASLISLNNEMYLHRPETNIRIATSSEKIVYILLGCIGIFGNLLVIIAVTTVKSRPKHFADLLIVNQSAIDLLSSVFIIATTLTADTGFRKLSGIADELYCRFWISGYIIWSLFLSSTYNLVLLTMERYMAIVHPIRHHTLPTEGTFTVSVIMVWCIGPAYNLMYRVPTSGLIDGVCYKFVFMPSRLIARVFGVVSLLVQFFVPLVTFIYAYFLMTVRLKSKVHPTVLTPGPSNTATGARRNSASQAGRLKERASKNIFKMMVTVTLCFVICWITNQVMFLLFNFGYHIDFQSPLYHFTIYVAFANSCVNPFIYTFQYSIFRHGLRDLFCGYRGPASSSDQPTGT